VNRVSVRELEERNAVERQELMQALLENLSETGVKAGLQQEPAVNGLDEEALEPVINLEGQNVKTIRLVGIDSGGDCGLPGEILRLQYLVQREKALTPDEMKDLYTFTRIIREGKFRNFFGGKVTGIQWVGQKLATALNQDPAITDAMLRCAKSWSYLEFQIEALSPTEVSILGPRFSNPGAIAALYHSEDKEEIECCAFGYSMMEKIAGHIKTAG
jgi:hypothetical protein